MSEITLTKLPNNLLMAATPEDAKKLARIKTGDCLSIKYTRKRNGAFFRKWHALVSYAYDMWEPEEGAPEKNYDRFRKEVTMLAGYYHTVPCVKGGVRYEADSIGFANMDEDTFSELYEATVRALLKWVLKNYTRADLDSVLRNIGEFV